MASSSGSPCAACKFLRRKCTSECVFAPYFPPEQPQKFANVHKIFGASNVTKLLNDLPAHQREDAVNSLAYEAEARVKDPVYGCVGVISILQRQVLHLQKELVLARSELSRYTLSPPVTPPPTAIALPFPLHTPLMQDLINPRPDHSLTRDQLLEFCASDSHSADLHAHLINPYSHLRPTGAPPGTDPTGNMPPHQ